MSFQMDLLYVVKIYRVPEAENTERIQYVAGPFGTYEKASEVRDEYKKNHFGEYIIASEAIRVKV